MISLRREKKRKHELKAGISWKGWERVAKDRWATRGKRAFLSAADGGSFLKEWSADLATSCDHAKVSEVIWSSDGASWLKEGPGLFSCTHAQLDRFHLKRSLSRALAFSGEASHLFSLACCGKAEEVISALCKHLEKETDEKKRKRISEAISYISSLSAWLTDLKESASGPSRGPFPRGHGGKRGGAHSRPLQETGHELAAAGRRPSLPGHRA